MMTSDLNVIKLINNVGKLFLEKGGRVARMGWQLFFISYNICDETPPL